ncbi:CLUMA_CG014327, isoform A [Clunio marinus]|uniref:CLUMA_CG014327, isoform A n=1 Tax=Clunio marinus TaxID=568069 RepID=A0A1J1ILG6_9DIPT|nr:CLUMA_CG014327, isoform A [Clunio marinus]
MSFLIVQSIFLFFDLTFFCFSVVGNSVVIYVISRDKKLKSKSNYHIMSVAVADLLIGTFGIPLGIISRITGAPHDLQLCLMFYSFILAIFSVSMFSLLAVSVDRFWAVYFPMDYHVRDPSIAKLAIFCCWVFGLAIGFLPVMGWNSGNFDNQCDFRVVADLNYVLFVSVAVAFPSTSIIILLYILIYRKVLKHTRKRKEILANQYHFIKHKYEIRAAKTLAMIVGTFILLWTPGMVGFLFFAISKNREIQEDILEIAKSLVHLNSAIDPLIYAYRMKNIRDALKVLFKFCRNDDLTNITTLNDRKTSLNISVNIFAKNNKKKCLNTCESSYSFSLKPQRFKE